ncbi:hypothetical protein [Ligilactobacillus salivarius]|uniref:Lipoprotein n=1 Tax=Ligilactobacillus salivarius TaxID=1624 RepID=A0A1Y0F8N2_9LACO|nr:hypothetical protein [Ligilactobacillus salivarius]ARU19656.1 hypothetical protein B7R82_06485 [Ligilactobacillus salivarius]UHL93222.1 hypothetical protein LVD18_02545 [Ligilactobacillus salivarius]
MKKINAIIVALLSISVLSACSNSNSNSRTSSESYKSSSLKAKKAKESSKKKAESIKKAKEEAKKKASESEKKASESAATASSQQITQQQDTNTYQAQSSTPVKSQSQINMERGYDPKGNPVMPGQDHAPGSDVYGNSDDWVRGQTEWLKSQGLTDTSQYNNPENNEPEYYQDEQ